MIKEINIFKILFVSISIFFAACKKEFDIPPVKPVSETARINIAAIKSRYNTYSVYRFSGDTNLYCVVTADEASGNLYKDVYVKDATGGLHIKLVASGGLFIGDSIRINLNGVLLNNTTDLVQLDSVDLGKNIVKLASGLNPKPEVVTIPELIASTTAKNKFQSRLIQINDIEFMSGQRNQPYANTTTKAALQYTIQDCSNNKVTLRTSGYAYFASQNTPGGHGSIVAIASQYSNGIQLIIRNPGEINMSGPLCPPIDTTLATGVYLNKNFDDNIVSSNGWTIQNASGTVNWTTSTAGGASNSYCQATNYRSGINVACETWLISPALSLAGSVNPVLTFKNAYKYDGPALALYVSTGYTAGAPSAATWTALPFTLSAGNFVFINSGNVLLNAYRSNNTRIAFVYSGTANTGSTWEIDDILVKEN